MKILMIPNHPTIDIAATNMVLTPADQLVIGGYFYDYFRNSANEVLGVRLWLDKDGVSENSVFQLFLNDLRVKVHEQSGYVDLLFDIDSSQRLERGEIFLDSAQDFGGMQAMRFEQEFGIYFSI